MKRKAEVNAGEIVELTQYLKLKAALPEWLTERLNASSKPACEGKRRYGHQETAERAVSAMFKKYGGNRMESYHCKTCDGWHIGHSNAVSVIITRGKE